MCGEAAMKAYLTVLASVLVLLASAAHADEASPLATFARDVGCLTCHALDKRSNDDEVGPPFRAVAEKYRGNTTARDKVMTSISTGSKGDWGPMTRGVPMPPYSGRLTRDEIARLTDWILTLKSPGP